jgi:hypothetical protein
VKYVRTTMGEFMFRSRGLHWGVKVGKFGVRLWHLVVGGRC